MLASTGRSHGDQHAGPSSTARTFEDDVSLLRDALSIAMRSDGGDGAPAQDAPIPALSAPEAQIRVRALTRDLKLINLAEPADCATRGDIERGFSCAGLRERSASTAPPTSRR